ncbi:hypothetical protein MTR67_013671 [Solanum verrucosum]|uniref:F-box domain-containing protein n=1 Tax=Solanum verrucosum TaxID=315347 RepID=A0AAF0TI49_SOLVR|nr:hypothetical protein MTR67_013671 [Solanum verrucosum]
MELTNLKKQKITEEEAPMNKLPDPLLVQILSLLPTKDAFRTCLVSTTWRRLLTFIHSFNFTCREREDLSFIHNALAHSLSSKIIKFQLDLTYLRLSDCSFRPEYETLIGRCFSFAVERQVENVVLWSQYSNRFTLPESLCTCSSLITLDVQNCDLNKAVIAWNSLKSIKLGHLKLTDDDMLDDFLCHFLDNSLCNSELLDLANGDNMDLLSGVPSVEFHNLKKVKIVISSEACLKDHVKGALKRFPNLQNFYC